jgi:hypothetical protein
VTDLGSVDPLPITEDMARPPEWIHFPSCRLDRMIYGRIVCAVRHRSGALLLHQKPYSRNSRCYRKYGQWLLVFDRVVIRSKCYYNSRPIMKPPTRWARRVLSNHAAGMYAREWARHQESSELSEPVTLELEDWQIPMARPFKVTDQLVWQPPGIDELPRSHYPFAKPFTMKKWLRGMRHRQSSGRRSSAAAARDISAAS